MRIMKNSIPIATVPRVRNICCKFYSTAACLLIRRLFISGNAFCIFRIGKDDAGRWCCINKGGFYWDKNKYSSPRFYVTSYVFSYQLIL